jgi:AhpD family alkylhydroperoxidase
MCGNALCVMCQKAQVKPHGGGVTWFKVECAAGRGRHHWKSAIPGLIGCGRARSGVGVDTLQTSSDVTTWLRQPHVRCTTWKTTVDSSGPEPLLLELIRRRTSRINGCAYCMDTHSVEMRVLSVERSNVSIRFPRGAIRRSSRKVNVRHCCGPSKLLLSAKTRPTMRYTTK